MEAMIRTNPFGISLNGRVYDSKVFNEYLEQFKKKFGKFPPVYGEIDHNNMWFDEIEKLTFSKLDKEISENNHAVKIELFKGVKMKEENLTINYIDKENSIEVDYQDEKTTRYYKRTLPKEVDYTTMKAFLLDDGGLEITMEKKAGE